MHNIKINIKWIKEKENWTLPWFWYLFKLDNRKINPIRSLF